jgi:hypothetical protein
LIRARNANNRAGEPFPMQAGFDGDYAMRVSKLRAAGADDGLIPVGAYFERLAADFRSANAIAAARQDTLNAEDARLEARYRRASSARARPPETAHAAL